MKESFPDSVNFTFILSCVVNCVVMVVFTCKITLLFCECIVPLVKVSTRFHSTRISTTQNVQVGAQKTSSITASLHKLDFRLKCLPMSLGSRLLHYISMLCSHDCYLSTPHQTFPFILPPPHHPNRVMPPLTLAHKLALPSSSSTNLTHLIL